MLNYHDGPIVACSTSLSGDAAIALIRFSGFKDLFDLQCFLSFDVRQVKKRQSFFTKIVDGEKTLDTGLGVFFPAPHSYNGENIFELSVHGNRLNVERLLALFSMKGCFRLAHPGEFTYRALKNQKLSLSQVEGLDLLLNAKSSLMLQQGQDILQGELHQNYQRLYQIFLKLRVGLELNIDFSEDVGDERAKQEFFDHLNQLSHLVDSLAQRSQGDLSAIMTPEVVLLGPVNAGKSSFFNLLLKQERAIVSHEAGTTRDYVSEYIFIKGNSFRLIDTAGIRQTEQTVESKGIKYSLDLAQKAFFKIIILNPFSKDEIASLGDLLLQPFDLLVLTHQDLPGFIEAKKKLDLSSLQFKQQIDLSTTFGPIGPNQLSGSIGPVLKVIEQMIVDKYNQLTAQDPIIIERHRLLIRQIDLQCKELSQLAVKVDDVGIWANEVDHLGRMIAELIGIITPDQVLTSIFQNFCIGK